MKKTIATMGIFLTMAAAAFTGTALPASAHCVDAPEMYLTASSVNETFDTTDAGTNKNVLDNNPQDWIDDDEDFSIIRGSKSPLDFRTDPSDTKGSVIGQLHDGDEVLMTTRWEGDYAWVYSEDLGCYGWINGIYLG